MNIYIPRGGGPGIRQEISTWRARDDVVSGRTFSSVAFLRVLRYVATRNPLFQGAGDYFLLICITPRPTKGARDRPCHCNVNKLRLPDLLPRGGHASSFVIAPPLSLGLMPRPRPATKHFSPTPAFPRTPPIIIIIIIIIVQMVPESCIVRIHVAILRVINFVKLEFSAAYRANYVETFFDKI